MDLGDRHYNLCFCLFSSRRDAELWNTRHIFCPTEKCMACSSLLLCNQSTYMWLWTSIVTTWQHPSDSQVTEGQWLTGNICDIQHVDDMLGFLICEQGVWLQGNEWWRWYVVSQLSLCMLELGFDTRNWDGRNLTCIFLLWNDKQLMRHSVLFHSKQLCHLYTSFMPGSVNVNFCRKINLN